MITKADELLAVKAGKSLEDYFLDNLVIWTNTLESLSQNQKYIISNGQNSKRELERVQIKEAQSQVDYWTEKIECLDGKSLTAPKIRTLFTTGYPYA
ncbi:MAG: hypothetical protein ACTSP9_13180 [Promethearchaeota archaeon]